jgi:ankyrin repeat protein
MGNNEESILKLLNNNDYKKLFEIKNINDIIIEENKILHLLAIRGNEEGINYYIKKGFDINISNLKGENIIHLFFRYGFDHLAEKYYKLYPDFLSKYDNELTIPLFYCVDRLKSFSKCLKFMEKNKFNIKELINTVSFEGENIITRLIDFSYADTKLNKDYYDFIKENLDLIDFSRPNKYPPLIYCILGNRKELIELFIENKKGLNEKNHIFLYPLNIACSKNNIETVKLLLKHNDINYGGVEMDYLPVNIAINNNLFDLLDILIDYIDKNDGDFMIIDKFRNTYLHYISDKILYFKQNNILEIERRLRQNILKIIEKTDIDFENNNKLTPRQLLLQYIKLKDNVESTDISDIKHLQNIIKKKNIDDSSTDEEFTLIKSNRHYNSGLFGADIFYKSFYILYLLKKYKDLSIPILNYSEEIQKELMYKMNMQSINYDSNYYIIASIYYTTLKYLYPLLPSNILWKNKDLHYVHPDLFNIIRKNKTRFILLTVSLIIAKNFTHANCILIDRKNNTIRRFEPYGLSNSIDDNDFDDYMHKNIEKCLKQKFFYLKPSDYLDKTKFQVLSNDNDDNYRKMGDPLGYCLAWCFWFIELKLNNPDLDEKNMVLEATEKIMKYYKKNDNPFMYFIRDYARKLNEEKDKILKKIKIESADMYDINYKNKNLKKISEYINKYKF